MNHPNGVNIRSLFQPRVDDAYASEFHVRIGVQDDSVVLNDLGSTNGTYVNGRRVTVPTTLQKGDAVQIGKTIIEVR